jgi:putative DNA primase/helicase
MGEDDFIKLLSDLQHGELPSYVEDTLALQFASRHQDELRFVAKWNRWLMYDGKRWAEDDTLHIYDLVRALCRETALNDDKSTIASAKSIAAVEKLARTDRRLAARIAQWDADIWLLNTPKGVIDLRSGDTHSHEPLNYLTKMTTVESDSECPIPLWLAFLKRVTGGDSALVGFLQRMAGYSLTGSIREHALFFHYGTGANGKSTFANVLSGILGDYQRTAPIETFIAAYGERHPTDLAGFQGARLVTAIETEEGRRWDETKVKTLTGGDRVSARFMRQDFFEYQPQFKLMIAGNHKPALRSVDEAIRRRLHLIPWSVVIPAAERDKELPDKLRPEWPGILHWMVQGCLRWQKIGLAPPKAVADATDAYIEGEDAFTNWIEEWNERDANHWQHNQTLFASWKAYCDKTGEFVGSMSDTFSMATNPCLGLVQV